MGTLFVYIVKSALCLALLYLPYTLLLRKEALHRMNRAALLGILLVSFLVPALHGTPFGHTALLWQTAVWGENHTVLFDEMEGVNIAMLPSPDKKASGVLIWASLLAVLYIIGIVVSLCVRLWQFVSLWRSLFKGCMWKERRKDGITLYCHAGSLSPYSWMNSIVVSEEDMDGEAGKAVLLHEEAHVRYGHSYDTLLILAAETLMWFNPLVWMLEADMRCIHEYQADDYVLRHEIDEKTYQLYLIKKAVGLRLQSFANGLNQSTPKKRIAMMCNKKTNKWAACKYLYLLPAGAMALMSFASPEVVNSGFADRQLEEIAGLKVTDLSGIVKIIGSESPENADTVYKNVDVQPEFPNGPEAFMKFLIDNVHYPDSCLANGIEGQVIACFVVYKDGSLSKDVKILRSPHPDMSEEVRRVVALMPKWKPGKLKGEAVNCAFTIPVSFRYK